MQEGKILWRLEDELLTLEKVDSSSFREPPLGCWLPVAVGSGNYIYFETFAEAKSELTEILYDKQKEITNLLLEVSEFKEEDFAS